MDPGRQCLCMTTEYMYLFTLKTLNVAYYAPTPSETKQSQFEEFTVSRREIQINNFYDNIKSFMI